MARLTAEQEALLKGKNFANLATVREDGSPQVTPIWIDYVEGEILINTRKGRVKDRNMRRDPRVSLSILDQANPYTYVAITGRVEILDEGERAWEHIDDLQEKYHGNRNFARDEGAVRVMLRVVPDIVVGE
jgi:PPOX class probable F420-dependent enzyme